MTVRHVKGNNPIRIILDDKNSLDKDLNVFNGESETLVIENFLKENNLGNYICEFLHKNKIQSIIIEGGKKTLDLFIKNNIYGKKIVVGMGAGTISSWMRELPKLI